VHPAIDPPIMPTLMPVTPEPLGAPPREVTAIRQRSGHLVGHWAVPGIRHGLLQAMDLSQWHHR
jgi:hypothetical protein